MLAWRSSPALSCPAGRAAAAAAAAGTAAAADAAAAAEPAAAAAAAAGSAQPHAGDFRCLEELQLAAATAQQVLDAQDVLLVQAAVPERERQSKARIWLHKGGRTVDVAQGKAAEGAAVLCDPTLTSQTLDAQTRRSSRRLPAPCRGRCAAHCGIDSALGAAGRRRGGEEWSSGGDGGGAAAGPTRWHNARFAQPATFLHVHGSSRRACRPLSRLGGILFCNPSCQRLWCANREIWELCEPDVAGRTFRRRARGGVLNVGGMTGTRWRSTAAVGMLALMTQQQGLTHCQHIRPVFGWLDRANRWGPCTFGALARTRRTSSELRSLHNPPSHFRAADALQGLDFFSACEIAGL